MEKFNPQPEPPGRASIWGWLVYVFEWLVWIVTLPFQDAGPSILG